MRLFFGVLILMVWGTNSVLAFNGTISMGGNIGLGSSLLFAGLGQSEKAPTDYYIRRTTFQRILYPDVDYGACFRVCAAKEKKVRGYFQTDVYLQNHWLSNRWQAFDTTNNLIYTKKTFYEMFELGLNIELGFTVKHITVGMCMANIFTLYNHYDNSLFFQGNTYGYSGKDTRGVNEATPVYKIDIGFKIGYQYITKRKLIIEPFFMYSFGAFHYYLAPFFQSWGPLFEQGRIDSFRFGIVLLNNLKLKK